MVTGTGITVGTTRLDCAAEPDLEVCVLSSAALRDVVGIGSADARVLVWSKGSELVGSRFVSPFCEVWPFGGVVLVSETGFVIEPSSPESPMVVPGSKLVGSRFVPSFCEV